MSIAQQAGYARQSHLPDPGPGNGTRLRRLFLLQLRALLAFFVRPVEIVRNYHISSLRPDLIAGMTVAVITIPQAMAYALIAELPPQTGLYAAIVGAIVGALWGSSNQLQTGPTNTTSLLILSVLLGVAAPGTPEYLAAAGIMALMVGVFRLVVGLARLGMLVNFISDSVVVGFTSGAAVLIFVNQIRHLLRLEIASQPHLWGTVPSVVTHLAETHWPSLLLSVGTIALLAFLRRRNRKLPGPLIAMVAAAIVTGLLGLGGRGVNIVGELPRSLPPVAKLPIFDVALVSRLATGSIAVAAIGLIEAMSIARSIASYTGQRIDSNQEFVGQGLANIACGFLSGYTASGSFTRSAVNFNAGARTPLASVFGSLFVLLTILALGPLAAYVPLPALAAVITLTAYGLINRGEIVRIWRSGQGDRFIMAATLLATLTLPLQFAVMTGIVLSLAHYLVKTSTPVVRTVGPDEMFRHFVPIATRPPCPQLGIVEILGDLYFGAADHIVDRILEHLDRSPDERFLILRMHSVEHCDISGTHALENIRRAYRERGGDIFFVRVRTPVLDFLKSAGYYDYLGSDHFLPEDEAVAHLFYKVLDPAICIYECSVRAFRECQNLPKSLYPIQADCRTEAPRTEVPSVPPQALWQALHDDKPPLVLDVREPREFKRGHIPGAHLIPLPTLLADTGQVPRGRPVVFVCQGGRRSTRAAAMLRDLGYDNVAVLKGGMLTWEAANLLEAID